MPTVHQNLYLGRETQLGKLSHSVSVYPRNRIFVKINVIFVEQDERIERTLNLKSL